MGQVLNFFVDLSKIISTIPHLSRFMHAVMKICFITFFFNLLQQDFALPYLEKCFVKSNTFVSFKQQKVMPYVYYQKNPHFPLLFGHVAPNFL